MTEEDYFNEILNERELEQVRQFLLKEDMVNGVRKILLAGVYKNGVIEKDREPRPLVNTAFELADSHDLTDDALGRNVRSKWEGIKAIELAFKAMETLNDKNDEKVEKIENDAR